MLVLTLSTLTIGKVGINFRLDVLPSISSEKEFTP